MLHSLGKASSQVIAPAGIAVLPRSAVCSRAVRSARATVLAESKQHPHLEEVDLHSAVAEVQDDGATSPEPCAEVG